MNQQIRFYMPACGSPRASRALTDLYDAALRPVGLKITQFSALRTVQRMGPVSISALADEMALDRSTLGRNQGDDERAVARWEQAQAKVDRLLGKEGVSTLVDLLARVEQLR